MDKENLEKYLYYMEENKKLTQEELVRKHDIMQIERNDLYDNRTPKEDIQYVIILFNMAFATVNMIMAIGNFGGKSNTDSSNISQSLYLGGMLVLMNIAFAYAYIKIRKSKKNI